MLCYIITWEKLSARVSRAGVRARAAQTGWIFETPQPLKSSLPRDQHNNPRD